MEKYLKYKNKYTYLKNLIGGMTQVTYSVLDHLTEIFIIKELTVDIEKYNIIQIIKNIIENNKMLDTFHILYNDIIIDSSMSLKELLTIADICNPIIFKIVTNINYSISYMSGQILSSQSVNVKEYNINKHK